MTRRHGLSLLIRNLRYEVSPEELRETFEEFGEVRDVYIPLDYYARRPRGFGFVEFRDDEDARYALKKMDRKKVHGQEITVQLAQERRKSPETMREREDDNRNDRRRSHSTSDSRSADRDRSDRDRRGRDDRRDDDRQSNRRRDD
eukprot:GHVL01039903.1.p1 GENE.GHVL01039903.1~~GHVL01039903.1.p1  ORF type:complete len:159 (-),score=35.67 GHVL01039903.1:526-960(-)